MHEECYTSCGYLLCMGGNALKKYGVRRVDCATYERIKTLVLAALAPACLRAEVPLALPDKLDHGDVDILAVINPEIGDLSGWIDRTFAPRGHVLTKEGIHSFNVEDLQIDLIPTTEERWDSHYAYLCWGDLSMVIGRVARLYDLKYGIDGLALAVRHPLTGTEIASLLVSSRPDRVLPFLGYDYNRWLRGFANEAETCAFAFSSDRLSRRFSDAESQNTKHRKRERSRGAFRRYYEWAEAHLEQFPLVALNPVPVDPWARAAYIEASFPGSEMKQRLHETFTRKDRFRLAREKFSSTHVTALFPDLVGERLGGFNQIWLKQWPSKEAQVDFINQTDVAELQRRAAAIYAGMPVLAIS